MQNPVLECIALRRSIRAYHPEQLSETELSAILDAALAAPSAVNAQPWHFSVVQQKTLIERINEAFRRETLKTAPAEQRARFEDPAYSVFYHAPTVIFVSCPSTEVMKYAETDSGMAIQNIALAAQSLGLGSVILGMPRMAFEGPEADDLREALAFPAGYDYILSIAIGFPAASKDAHPVLDGRVTVLR